MSHTHSALKVAFWLLVGPASIYMAPLASVSKLDSTGTSEHFLQHTVGLDMYLHSLEGSNNSAESLLVPKSYLVVSAEGCR